MDIIHIRDKDFDKHYIIRFEINVISIIRTIVFRIIMEKNKNHFGSIFAKN